MGRRPREKRPLKEGERKATGRKQPERTAPADISTVTRCEIETMLADDRRDNYAGMMRLVYKILRAMLLLAKQVKRIADMIEEDIRQDRLQQAIKRQRR
jgi:hypothetical protein